MENQRLFFYPISEDYSLFQIKMGLKVFNFICENGHTFEAMVPSIEAFEEQKKNGFFTCPVCNSNVISRALSAPHIQASSTQKDVSQNTVEAMHTVYKTVKKILDEHKAKISIENKLADDKTVLGARVTIVFPVAV